MKTLIKPCKGLKQLRPISTKKLHTRENANKTLQGIKTFTISALGGNVKGENANKTLQGIKTRQQFPLCEILIIGENANKTLQGIKTFSGCALSAETLSENANKTLQGIKTVALGQIAPGENGENANKTLQGIKTRSEQRQGRDHVVKTLIKPCKGLKQLGRTLTAGSW